MYLILVCILCIILIVYLSSLKHVYRMNGKEFHLSWFYPQKKRALELVSSLNQKMTHLIVQINKIQDPKWFPYINNINQRYPNIKFEETEPLYNYTSYIIGDGQIVSICIRDRKPGFIGWLQSFLIRNSAFENMNTLIFVMIHELTHISIGWRPAAQSHNNEFIMVFTWLLDNAIKNNIYIPIDYKKYPETYCGMTINSSPLYF